MDKLDILKKFNLSKNKEELIQTYLECLREYNSHTNVVGKSTLINPWVSHILDSLQILPHIEKKNFFFLFMGTGAGLPGFVLSIAGCKNITLVDSNGKKINFLKNIQIKTKVKVNIVLGRIEEIPKMKYDVVVSRALTKLTNLLTYSQKFVKKNTVLIFFFFLTVNEEVEEARKKWNFQLTSQQSISDSRGSVLIIKNIRKK